MTGSKPGILSVGSYLPRPRLAKRAAVEANRWFAPSLRAREGEHRTYCDWDEDALTMAVEAARACLAGHDANGIGSIELASTSLPFADRSNTGVVREALDLSPDTRVQDSGGSLRAASTALERLLTAGDGGSSLLLGADAVDAKPASSQELGFGHGAAAVLVGEGDCIATPIGGARLHQDFVDHYRAAGERFEYALESRWTRDAGYREQVVVTVERALAAGNVDANRVMRLAVSAPGGIARAVGRRLAAVLPKAATDSVLEQQVGFCGAAQPLLALVESLESAGKGDVIALVSLGQGVDVVLLEVVRPPATRSLEDAIAGGHTDENYTRYLALRGLMPLEAGIRAERDNRTAQSASWRMHEAVTAFKGGQCAHCGTLQFPPTMLCVQCGQEGTQEPRRLADLEGRVRTFTEDWLAYTPKPPLIFGNVGFADGANVLMEFTDVAPGQLEVGMPVSMKFRIKDTDERRHFRRYFWKPAPAAETDHA